MTKITSRGKNYNFITLAQLTKYSRNTTKQSTKSILISFWWNWAHILNQQLHVRFTRYCLVVMKFFTLYSAKYKKQVSNLRCRKMPLFTVLSFRTPKSAENLEIISTNSWKSAQCMFYVKPLYWRRTTEGDYNTPFDVSEQRHAMRPGKWMHSGKVTWRSGCCR